MTNAVATRGQNVPVTDYSRMSMAERAKYANTLSGAKDLIKRGLFDNATGKPSWEKIFLVLETGAMLGLHPMASLQGIDVIEGNATISPQLMTGLIRSAGHKIRIRKSGTVEGGDYAVTVIGIRFDDPDEEISDTWTPHRAARAGLCTYTRNERTGIWEVRARNKTGEVALPWEKWTENMCLWRATGNVGREGFNDVLMGVAYTPEEFDIHIDEEGLVVDEITPEAENALIERMKTITDKADMVAVFKELDANDGWTPRIRAEFDTHIATLTVDSRPPKEGAPGQTGVAELDMGPTESTESTPVDSEPSHAPTEPVESVSTPTEEKKTPQNGAQRTEAIDPDEWEREEIRRFEESQMGEDR